MPPQKGREQANGRRQQDSLIGGRPKRDVKNTTTNVGSLVQRQPTKEIPYDIRLYNFEFGRTEIRLHAGCTPFRHQETPQPSADRQDQKRMDNLLSAQPEAQTTPSVLATG